MPRLRYPKKDIVKFIIREALQNKKVRSQTELVNLMKEKLRKGDRNYTISGERLRKIASDTPEIRIRIHTKHGSIPKRCPSCSKGLKKLYSKNLSGKNILVGLKCSRCAYRGHENKWVPMRYEFELAREG